MMLAKIEKAVLDHLKTNWKDVSEFDLGKSFSNLRSYPAVAVTIENIGFQKEVKGVSTPGYILEPTVSVYVVFKALQPEFRREGIYPMVELAAALLAGRTLGLDIEPLEPAGQISELFSQEIAQQGCVAFRINVKTAFELAIQDDSEMTALLETFNTYHYREWESDTQEIELPNDSNSTIVETEDTNENTESNS
ncbi:MAG: DUF1834 family protein [Chitinispirillia bacterium]|nr:DUF1834 family protein [Chitinispirillia bacterium]